MLSLLRRKNARQQEIAAQSAAKYLCLPNFQADRIETIADRKTHSNQAIDCILQNNCYEHHRSAKRGEC